MQSGNVHTISISVEKGTTKHSVPSAQMIAGSGIAGDAHAGFDHRQVSFLALESFELMRTKGAAVDPGDFAENITTTGIDWHSVAIGTMIQIGDVKLKVSQIGKVCHERCAIYELAGDCIMPREGIFATVESGGVIYPGNTILVDSISDA